MSDFDTVLERLLLDPQFKAAMMEDPGRSLAGYQLDDAEREMLTAGVAQDPGGQSKVEERTSKASMMGLMAAFSEGLGEMSLGGPDTAPSTVGPSFPGGVSVAVGDISGSGHSSPGEMVGFNPQPDPPGTPAAQNPPEGDMPAFKLGWPGAQASADGHVRVFNVANSGAQPPPEGDAQAYKLTSVGTPTNTDQFKAGDSLPNATPKQDPDVVKAGDSRVQPSEHASINFLKMTPAPSNAADLAKAGDTPPPEGDKPSPTFKFNPGTRSK